jgi:NDP-sugar pyrophosphorylase family protein
LQLPALVLTAGLATRLRPLSLLRAKAALPVAGSSLAARVIRWLAGFGVRDVVLNLHHRPETITRLIGDGSDLGVRVRYSWEDPLLGTAGGPRHALPLLDSSRFLIVNGDTLSDVDLGAMVAAHDDSGATVTMALIPNPRPEQYGGVLLDGDRVSGFTPREARARNFHFIGVQVVEREAFASLPDNEPSESVTMLYPALMKARPGAVRAFVSRSSFEDIGTPRDYFETCLAIARRAGSGLAQRGYRTAISPSADVSRSILWDDVVVEDGVKLADCIVTDGVRIPAGTQLSGSLVLPASAERLGVTGERRDDLLIAGF